MSQTLPVAGSGESRLNQTQALLGLGVLAVAGVLAWGATSIPSNAGYAGVGPNFLPWVVSGLLALCGGFLVWEAASGGFRAMGEPDGAERGDWKAFGWVSAAILLNAGLITSIGFILSCALCFVLAVRGFKLAEGRFDLSLRAWVQDALIGMAISAPVYWMFTKALAISLPGLTQTGWL
ncbi:putative tricarboxylic transport membrane protein [Sphaerotilus hippei]|uniref:Putative tricarboxylic transport membrane protein n=1 Tax=Sphaerotilus hippei TaxID=744406 RepID=A0A318GYH4_9BURK|nr:tripartite tricarboxylate transporter TctB family protein [Sphaerotilus hippei]PXW95014.1 putative tricarboxylic transport membrane protein [Sphaerotilus hippei]